MIKKDFQDGIQACINEYGGEYGKPIKIYDETEKHEIDNIEFHFGYKKEFPNRCYLNIRGSDDPIDWYRNLQFKYITIEKIYKISEGFLEDNNKIMPLCFKKFEEFDEIVIEGHSKGADQALILNFFTRLYKIHGNVKCVAFAPAGCMNKKARNVIKDNTVVFINKGDYITKLPQWRSHHPGKIIRLGKQSFLNYIPFVRLVGLMDHYPQEYKKMIAKTDSKVFENLI